MTTLLAPGTAPAVDVLAGVRPHVSVRDTLTQTMTMAWRAGIARTATTTGTFWRSD